MAFCLALFLHCLAIASQDTWLYAAAAMYSFLLAFWLFWQAKGKQNRGGIALLLLLSLAPLGFLSRPQLPSLTPPPPFAYENLNDTINPDLFVGVDILQQIQTFISQNHDGKPVDVEGFEILSKIKVPQYTSLTLFDLEFEPLAWQGEHFAEQPSGPSASMLDRGPSFVLRDGRLFLTNLYPLPSFGQQEGYLAMSILILSHHNHDWPRTWLGRHFPSYTHYRPVFVSSDEADFVRNMAININLAPPPFDVTFVPKNFHQPWLDLIASSWAILLACALFYAERQFRSTWFPLFLLACSVCLYYAQLPIFDHLSSFASHIFAHSTFGNAFSSPFHTLLSTALILVTLGHIVQRLRRYRNLLAGALFLLTCAMAVWLPGFMQSNFSNSIIHPLEAFESPGSFLCFMAFLASFGYVIGALNLVRSTRINFKIGIGSSVLLLAAILQPASLFPITSMFIAWLLQAPRAPAIIRAALVVTAFYPTMVLSEQMRELNFIRTVLLDEITLMSERNYFRMGRVMMQLDTLRQQLNRTPHPHLMDMFASDCGLFEDDIDFALRLIGPNGEIISEIDQHISIDRLPYFLGPANRIESYEDPLTGESWMIYRTSFITLRGDFEFVVVLGNDYQNLSLVRQLRRLDSDSDHSDRSPYFAYLVDVFRTDGTPIYSQGSPAPLSKASRNRLVKDPFFWLEQGRNTVFLVRDQANIFRITHKATPIRMILARFLTLVLTVYLLNQLFRATRWYGRNPLMLWQRSFSLKLATFMFLTSVVPTTTLGYFLIQSIQKNQAREANEIARSKITAAKGVFSSLAVASDKRGSGDPYSIQNSEDGVRRRFYREHPRHIPLDRFARALGEDLSLFFAGSLVQTNQPEVFRMGLIERRLNQELVRELIEDKKSFTLRRHQMPNQLELVTAYASFAVGPSQEAILSMTLIPFSQRQQLRWQEQLEFAGTVLIGLLFMMAGLTRVLAQNVLQPVQAITRAAARMARGLKNQPIVIDRQDELKAMVSAFNTMQKRIEASQKKLREQLALQSETFKSMASGLIGLDRQGNVMLRNEKAFELLQIGVHALNLNDMLQQQPALAPVCEAFDQDEVGTFELTVGEGTDTQTLLAKTRTPSSSDISKIHFILVVEDITDALAANRFEAWSEMARRVAHEIKNPLTPIRLEIDHLLALHRDQHPAFDQALQEAADEIKRQVEHLRATATEFSEYARPVSLEPAPTDLAALVHSLLAPYEKTMPGMQIRTTMPSQVVTLVDERIMRRALHNLVVNAVQAMEQEGTLHVRIHELDDQIELAIEDTGPGIDEALQQKIFEAYFSTKDTGSGLGLVIARRYIILHGGSLKIDRNYRDGTRFVIHLPYAKE